MKCVLNSNVVHQQKVDHHCFKALWLVYVLLGLTLCILFTQCIYNESIILFSMRYEPNLHV